VVVVGGWTAESGTGMGKWRIGRDIGRKAISYPYPSIIHYSINEYVKNGFLGKKD
jgi:hypothetical protein